MIRQLLDSDEGARERGRQKGTLRKRGVFPLPKDPTQEGGLKVSGGRGSGESKEDSEKTYCRKV